MLLAQLAAHSGGEREGRVPAARARLPLHHARRGRPRHRRLDHRAGLLPVQEEDGRGLRRVDRAGRRAAVAERRRSHRRILRHAGNLSRQSRSAGALHDRRRASREARARAATAGLRGCRLVLSAAEVEDGSRIARGRQERGRRVERAARQETRGAAKAISCRPTQRSASVPACRSPTRSRSPG